MRNLFFMVMGVGGVSLIILFFTAGGGRSIENAAAKATAAVFFVPSITTGQIQSDYTVVSTAIDPVTGVERPPAPTKKVRILIVPGHRPTIGGTEFGGVKERDVVVDIADSLASLLAKNSRYEVTVARTKSAWNPLLQSYFDTHATDIEAFMQSQKLLMRNTLASGNLLPQADQIYHDTVSSEAALELYGINKWANENKYDITLHLHINDDSDHRRNVAGAYDGFAVYVPNHQFSNAAASYAVGESIAARLNAYHATSTLPEENAGVVEDQDLIATGSNNSVDDAALLIEYGYIYEPQFQRSSVLPSAVADYAYQTYLGLQDFFKDPVAQTSGSVSFPYDWTNVTARKDESGPGIYALQSALHSLGYYPPSGRNFSDCPVAGVARTCTRSAIMEYQRAKDLEATGTLGSRTRAALFIDSAGKSSPAPVPSR